MNKFLRLVEEANPKVGYIVDIKGPDGTLMGTAAIPGSNTSFYEELAMFLRKRGGDVVGAVRSTSAAEDNQVLGDKEQRDEVDVVIADLEGDKAAGDALERRRKKVQKEMDEKIREYDSRTVRGI